jgi:voltage-gated potassium channel
MMARDETPLAGSLRRRCHQQVDPSARQGRGLSPFNRLAVAVIVLSVLVAVLDSEPTIVRGHERLFVQIEIACGLFFALEFALRLWVCAENPKFGPGLGGALRFLRSPAAIFDLLALAPLLMIGIGSEAYILRFARLLRVLRLAKLGRYSVAMTAIGEAVHSRRHELMMSAALAALVLLVASTLLYLVEGPAQPDSFGSIPRAMWWAIATLTTVGYGDIYPHTPVGKVLAGLTAITGIGLIAMPAGILAAAFSDALQRQRRAQRQPAADHGEHDVDERD